MVEGDDAQQALDRAHSYQDRLVRQAQGDSQRFESLLAEYQLPVGTTTFLSADAALSLLFCGIIIGVMLVQVFRAGPVTLYRIEGAVTVYLLIAYSWALAYQLVVLSDRGFGFDRLPIPSILAAGAVHTALITAQFTGTRPRYLGR